MSSHNRGQDIMNTVSSATTWTLKLRGGASNMESLLSHLKHCSLYLLSALTSFFTPCCVCWGKYCCVSSSQSLEEDVCVVTTGFWWHSRSSHIRLFPPFWGHRFGFKKKKKKNYFKVTNVTKQLSVITGLYFSLNLHAPTNADDVQ